MPAFLTLINFEQAWKKVSANQGCAGVDGETIAHFARQADTYLDRMRRAIANREYYPMPLRQIFIPKKDGRWRELRVPTVRDRIVQQAILNVLHPLLEKEFEPCSFAYRPGRSHKMAAEQVSSLYRRGYEWVLDADIVDYFNSVKLNRLIAEVQERVSPKDLNDGATILERLLPTFLQAGILTDAGIILPEKGIAQGSVISPILANVYLDDFDEILTASGLKLVRYADDFVVLAKKEQRIVEAKQEIAELLAGIGLQLHPDKTQITNFDRGFCFLGHTFAGDLVLPPPRHKHKSNEPKAVSSSPGVQLVYADPPAEITQVQKAMLEAIAASQQPIPPPLYVVLGYKIREKIPMAIGSNEPIWIAGMSALYLVNQGAMLAKEHGRFLVKLPNGSEEEIPIREVEQILVFGNIQLSNAAISDCLEAQIPVIFLTQLGEYKGHLWSANFGNLITEVAQWQRFAEADFQMKLVRSILAGKLANSRQLLLRLNRKRQIEGVATAISGIANDIDSLANAESLNALRGYEGVAASRYFKALGQLITNPGFSLTERTRRPPKDPVNSLLSFGYTLLYNNVLSLILAEGLNPYLGNLHRSDRKETHLAFDLMEEFRSPVVDSLVIKLINKQTVKPTDFSWFDEEGGTYLIEQGRRVFLKAFEARIGEMISHPDVQDQVSYRRAIQLQIRRYKKSLVDNLPYEAFLRAV
jgi:CRISP-associated protein Cas1